MRAPVLCMVKRKGAQKGKARHGVAGRDWPTGIEPTYRGYSIGRWTDEEGDGYYNA